MCAARVSKTNGEDLRGVCAGEDVHDEHTSKLKMVRTGELAPHGSGVFHFFAQDFNNWERDDY